MAISSYTQLINCVPSPSTLSFKHKVIYSEKASHCTNQRNWNTKPFNIPPPSFSCILILCWILELKSLNFTLKTALAYLKNHFSLCKHWRRFSETIENSMGCGDDSGNRHIPRQSLFQYSWACQKREPNTFDTLYFSPSEGLSKVLSQSRQPMGNTWWKALGGISHLTLVHTLWYSRSKNHLVDFCVYN